MLRDSVDFNDVRHTGVLASRGRESGSGRSGSVPFLNCEVFRQQSYACELDWHWPKKRDERKVRRKFASVLTVTLRWSFGVLMFEMLEGRPPFRDGNENRPHAARAGRFETCAAESPEACRIRDAPWQGLSDDYRRSVSLRARSGLSIVCLLCPSPSQTCICGRKVHMDDANCLIQQLLTSDMASRLKSAVGVKAGYHRLPTFPAPVVCMAQMAQPTRAPKRLWR